MATIEAADLTAADSLYAAAFGLGSQVRVKLALYGRRALAKDAGVAPDGTGSHRLIIGSDAGPFADPDGFACEAAAPHETGNGSAALFATAIQALIASPPRPF